MRTALLSAEREPFCGECGCYHDLRTPGCHACNMRSAYLERKLQDPEWYRRMLDRKLSERRSRMAEGRADSHGRKIAA